MNHFKKQKANSESTTPKMAIKVNYIGILHVGLFTCLRLWIVVHLVCVCAREVVENQIKWFVPASFQIARIK